LELHRLPELATTVVEAQRAVRALETEVQALTD